MAGGVRLAALQIIPKKVTKKNSLEKIKKSKRKILENFQNKKIN